MVTLQWAACKSCYWGMAWLKRLCYYFVNLREMNSVDVELKDEIFNLARAYFRFFSFN